MSVDWPFAYTKGIPVATDESFLKPWFCRLFRRLPKNGSSSVWMLLFKEFRKQQTLPPDQVTDLDDSEMLSIAHSVHRKRGSWWQVPKDMPDQDDDDE
jgi:hypothetical protein